MSHNTLIEKIESDAKESVAAIEQKQAETVAEIERETSAQVESLRNAHAKQLEKTLAHQELVALSRAKQVATIAVQSAKRAEIDLVLDTVHAELLALDSEAYVALYTKALSEAIDGASVVATAVHAPENREEETKQILKAVGLTADVTVNESIAAGLIVHTEAGVFDVTLDRLFAEKRSEMEIEVLNTLAG